MAAAVYGSHVVDGGFLSDSWAVRALYEFTPGGGSGYFNALDWTLDGILRQRPLQATTYATMNLAFADHMWLWLAALSVFAVFASTSLFALLRELGIPRWDAGAIGALVLIFPAVTSLRLWAAAPAHTLTIILVALGFLTALRAFDAEGRKRLGLHALSLALFVASLLMYEATLPLMLASVLLYRLRAPLRPAAARWAIDCAVLLPIVVTVTRAPGAVWETQPSIAETWDHALVILVQARELLSTTVLPFADRWYVPALLGLILIGAALAAARLPPTDAARTELRRWLGMAIGGVVVVVLSYSIFAPAASLYTPLSPGIGDRINCVASIGWTLLAYGTIRVLATMLSRQLTHTNWRSTATGLTALACGILAVVWLHDVRRDVDDFTQAYEENERVLRVIDESVPSPTPHSTIWAFGQPVEWVPGVMVFTGVWELDSAVKLMYRDPTTKAYVGYPGTRFDCRRDGVFPRMSPNYGMDRIPQARFASRYGRTYFIDTTTGRRESILSQRQCRRGATSFPRSPTYSAAAEPFRSE